ncbi:MAG: WXG100 family type VII secretion target [Propionibacteriaceae bacterium]|nr:WXG100 family type VII secretion target [Propionibacteriaceae bacterium]
MFSGMTPDQVDQAGNELRSQADALRAIRSRITSLIQEATQNWVGSDIGRFCTDWFNDGALRMQVTAIHLDEMANELTQQAAQQRCASQADPLVAPGIAGFDLPWIPLGPSPAVKPGENLNEMCLVPGSSEDMEKQLRDAGLLNDQTNALFNQWLDNAARHGVSTEEILNIAKEFNITPTDFEFMADWTVFTDPDGKSFFLLPDGASGEDAKKAVLMTYILNGGTDYGVADDLVDLDGDDHADEKSLQNQGRTSNDFQETPYSATEAHRIETRQSANSWTYDQDVPFAQRQGTPLVTTPNGMIMGLGGDGVIDSFSLKGGTTWGDIFMMNIDDISDPTAAMKSVIENGSQAGTYDDGSLYLGNDLDLDRLLHHEEIHSQQWADDGYFGFGAGYVGQAIWALGDGSKIRYEQEAGLADGGYER